MGTTLLLFNYDWDASGFARVAKSLSRPVATRGFDLFSFPSNAQLAWFDMDRFVNKLAKQAKAQNWTAVASQHEQFGALAAALLADLLQAAELVAVPVVGLLARLAVICCTWSSRWLGRQSRRCRWPSC